MQSAILKKLATGLILILIGGVLALSADSYLKAQVKPAKASTFKGALSQYVGQSFGPPDFRIFVSEVKDDYVILKLERTVSEPGTVSELLGGPRPKRLVTHDVKIPFGAILAITASDDGQLVDIAVLAGTSALTWAASGGD